MFVFAKRNQKSRLVSFPKTVFRKKQAAKTVYEFCGVANYLVAAKFLFAAKIMSMPCNNNIKAYIIATLLCGERKFAATSKTPKHMLKKLLSIP